MTAYAVLLAPILALLAPPPPGPPPPPPMPSDALPELERQRFVTFVAGPVRCAATRVTPTAIEQPMPSTHYILQRSGIEATPIELRFTIDATGRPVDIVSTGEAAGTIDASDVVPAFATWQFAPAAPHRDCSIAFVPGDFAEAEAPPASAMRYFAFDGGDRAIFDRTIPAGSTCFTPDAPPELVRVWPDFDTIPQRPGTRSFATIGYDIAANGKPIHVHVIASDGNRDLDAKGVAAIERSRYVTGARQGCTYPFRRTPTTPLQAPEGPKASALRPADADCEGVGDWTHLGLETFPQAFGKRAIEGWAIVSFDVAPWGETGNVKVLRAEPAEAFGTRAIETIRQSTKPPSRRGYTGCVEKVQFKMGPPGDAGAIVD